MKIGITVLIGCILCLSQDAASSSLKHRKKDLSRTEQEDYVRVKPGSKIYFHAIKDGNLMIGPRLSSRDVVTIHTLRENAAGARLPAEVPNGKYSVLKSGVLVPKRDESDGKRGKSSLPAWRKGSGTNGNVYKSRKLTFYVKGFKGILIPINLLYAKSKQRAVIDSKALLAKGRAEREDEDSCEDNSRCEEYDGVEDRETSRPDNETELREPRKGCSKANNSEKPGAGAGSEKHGIATNQVLPDKNCNGEITLFVLKSNGELQRMPPDPYLPMGIQLSYTMKDNFVISPKVLEKSNELAINYSTGKNGDLIPHADNSLSIRTEEGNFLSFMLGDSGTLIPVKEEMDTDEQINYYFNGGLVHRSRQFPEIFSNSDFLLFNDQKLRVTDEFVNGRMYGNASGHRIRKRSTFEEDLMAKLPPGRYLQPMGKRPLLQHSPGLRPPPGGALHGASVLPIGAGHCPAARRKPQAIIIRQPSLEHSPLAPVHHRQLHFPGRDPIFEAPLEQVAPLAARIVPEPEIPIHSHPDVVPVEFKLPPPPPEAAFAPAEESMENQSRMRVRSDLFTFDDKGVKIPLIPEITEQNDVVLYKLTCKGNLVRYPPCKEPEYGFEIHFQILLDEFILVPITRNNRPLHITYILQENGDLIPKETNENTFKKAPGSLIYFILGKNNVLFPVQQKVYPDGSLTFFYQDYYLLKMKNTANKPLHFSTVSSPMFAFFNGITMITSSSKPRLNPSRGSNWKNHGASLDLDKGGMSKDIFLTGPKGELVRVAPHRTKTGTTVIYEMDHNGILYRSPKDKKRCIILKSYIILKEGIFLPSNETTGYMYMTSKNGDMFPYLYPDGKLEAPQGESMKYLLCEKGILLPIVLEVVDNYICYFFHDVIVYKERVYCKDSLSALSDGNLLKLHLKDDCDSSGKTCDKSCRAGLKPFTTKDGTVVYYEKCKSLLKRHPPERVPSYLCYTSGSFEIQPDGSLFQIRYQDPDEDVINLMLEPNGDLLEDGKNERKPKSDYFILDVDGNLIAVEGRKTKKSIYFYKNQMKVCRVKLTEEDRSERRSPKSEVRNTPLGRDPLKLMEDPEPKKEDAEDAPQPLSIPIPLKGIADEDPEKEPGEKQSFDGWKETMALELEINDEIIEEIKNWAAKCDKLLSRREVEQSLSDALRGVNVARLLKSSAEAR